MSENTAKNLPTEASIDVQSTPAEAQQAITGGRAANDAPVPAAISSFEVLLGDVPLQVTVELGRIRMSLREIAQRLGPGSVIPLSKLTGESLDIRVNDRLVARAEAIAIGERYGVRIVEIISGDSK